jgi:hypothetical protein
MAGDNHFLKAASADHSSTRELEVRSESTIQFAPVENESQGP